ncbi:metallophosphoesterase [Desulfatirhabdium butyrativorans]|uniref:metallophosphoesterase n=1 Tax=Desulfatirhabdium butyrativorans TaxID=340467 RepID=UPI0004141D3D|nr:metallophosphoesterase [Desulfatirhabdium butyrativorans]
MTLFFLTYLLLYGGIHLYVFYRLQAAYPMSLPAKTLVIGALASMVISPVLVRFLERNGYELPANAFAHVGYLWMGLIFLFFSTSLIFDFYRLILHAGTWFGISGLSGWVPQSRLRLLLPLAVSLLLTGYGYAAALRIVPETVTIETGKLPQGMQRLRIAQISDVHLGLIVSGMRVERICKAIEKANPDILVSTGDLMDGQLDGLAASVERLRRIQPRFGKVAVTGNHEFYAGIEQSLQLTKAAGFRVLRGERFDVGNIVRFVGIDERTVQWNDGSFSSEKDLLPPASDRNMLTVLLKHRPVVRQASLGAFDLQLSGHTHAGQILPFSLVTRLLFPYHRGLYPLQNGSAIYVSRGTGTWGPPIRIGSAPEVTIIDFVQRG